MVNNSWTQVSLANLLIERDETPSSDQIATGAVPIISKIRFSDGQIEFRKDTATKTDMILIRPGDLVLSGINAMKGAIAIYQPSEPVAAAATIHYSAYTVITDKVDTHFLWWLLRSPFFRDVLEKQVSQGIKTELKAKRLLPVKIPLPPLDEQRLTVARIEAVAKRVAETERLQNDSLIATKALLASAISKLLSQYTSYKPFETLFSEPLRNGLPIKAKDMGGDRGIPFLKLGAVSFGKFDPSQIKLVDIDLTEESPFWVHPNDLLMGRGNSIDLVGRTVFYSGPSCKYAYSDLIIRIRINTQIADPEFIHWYLKSADARDYIETHAQGTSSTMKKVSQPLISKMPIPDLPLSIQKEIVAKMRNLQERVAETETTIRMSQGELTALVPAVLDRAFRGELIPYQ
jgi:type I restriction enzyme, S subunit